VEEIMTFTLQTPDPALHRVALGDLINRQWDRMASRIRDPYHRWSVSRMGLLDDEIVSFWGVFDLSMRIGSAVIPTAGVDCVVTHPDHRNQGYMRQTALAGLRSMKENGYALSLLNGIPRFYERFGYVNAWPQEHYIVDIGRLPASRPTFALEEFVPHEREDFSLLYNTENAGLTGTAVRPTYRTFKWPGLYTGYLWKDERDRPLGHIIGDYEQAKEPTDRFYVKDAAGDPEQILRLTGLMARQLGYRQVCFERLHYHSRLARRLRNMPCALETHYCPDGDFMLAILDFPALLEKLTGEFSRRMAAAPTDAWSGDLTLKYGAETVCLEIRPPMVRIGTGGVSEHVVEGDRGMARLIVGSDEPEATVADWDMRLSGEAERPVRVLFPSRRPQIASVDL
jgi:GNAT superfamily N-acetyltransferase